MNKQQFLAAVRLNAASVPPEELTALLDYYTEMIDEAMDEGCTEEEAVARLGSWDEIREQIHTFRAEPNPVSIIQPQPSFNNAQPETNTAVPASEPAKVKRWKNISLPTWAVVLLILTSPVWGTVVLTLLIVLFAVIFSLVVIGGALVISLFAVVIALAVVGVVGIPAGVVLLATSGIAPFLLTLGGGLVCVGLAILGGLLLAPFAVFFVSTVKLVFRGIAGFFRT